ncbi:MAG: hypothetical protein K5634_03785 [Sphaerochaetaceae bacterium]|nr:hypothetical protein [Sphaerochaetaceae bacterium]
MDTVFLKEQVNECDSLFSNSPDCGIRGTSALVLDLQTMESRVFDIPASWFNAYISGPSLGARLWAEFCGPGCDDKNSFESDNPVVITGGACTSQGMPFSENTYFVYLSPQNKKVTVNSVPSFLGARIQKCGYSALVLTGRLRRQTVIRIDSPEPSFEVSERFSMATTGEIEKSLNLSSSCSVLLSGPAAEKNVVFSMAVTDRSGTGRGGLGYVLGMKNLKALVVSAAVKENPDPQKYPKLCEYAAVFASGKTDIIRNANSLGWAPVNNYRLRTDPRLFFLSRDEITRTQGKPDFALDSQAVLMLGSNLGCYNPRTVVKRCAYALEMGLDPVSLGNILGYLKEAQERGMEILPSKADFTDNEDFKALAGQIISGTGFGQWARNGLAELAAQTGGEEFALCSEGMEFGACDVRGSFYQALSIARGHWFFPYPALYPYLCGKNCAGNFEYFESLSMGLESFGISASILSPVLQSLSEIKMRACGRKTSLLKKTIKPELILQSMGLGKESDITSAGVRLRILLDSMNASMGRSGMNIPDYFTIDPDSNYHKDSVVPFFDLCEQYSLSRRTSEATLLNL